jgi:hypothetical protein
MRYGLVITAIALVGLSVCAQEATAPAELSEAGKRYRQALSERDSGELRQALQTAANVVIEYPNDEDWLPKTELLCAELYVDVGLLDAADVTARQVQVLYEGTDTAAKATALRDRIKNLKAEQASEGSSE